MSSMMDEIRVIPTSFEEFEYTTINLLKQVEKQPVIWNRTHEDFRKREAIDEAWNQICRIIVPSYDDLDENDKQDIAKALLVRWKNCVSGLNKSAALKRKNDRSFRPFTYAREMKFYLEQRGIKFSDIFNADEVDGIEELTIKKELDEDKKEEEHEEVEEADEAEDVNQTPKNKKAKLTDNSMIFRSARLREKQTVLEKSLTEKEKSPLKNVKQTQIKTTPISLSGTESTSNISIDVIETAKENNVEEPEDNCAPPVIRPESMFTKKCAVNNTFNNSTSILNESDTADQAFFESIKPALRKMNETQKLDFQIDVLQILKTFRTN